MHLKPELSDKQRESIINKVMYIHTEKDPYIVTGFMSKIHAWKQLALDFFTIYKLGVKVDMHG